MLNSNKLKQGVKVTFGGEAEKTVSNICYDTGRIRSVSFTDGTILDWCNSLWGLAELAEPEVIWERAEGSEFQEGYESEKHLEHENLRFQLDRHNEIFILSEHIVFPDEQAAKNYANERVNQWRTSIEN